MLLIDLFQICSIPCPNTPPRDDLQSTYDICEIHRFMLFEDVSGVRKG